MLNTKCFLIFFLSFVFCLPQQNTTLHTLSPNSNLKIKTDPFRESHQFPGEIIRMNKPPTPTSVRLFRGVEAGLFNRIKQFGFEPVPEDKALEKVRREAALGQEQVARVKHGGMMGLMEMLAGPETDEDLGGSFFDDLVLHNGRLPFSAQYAVSLDYAGRNERGGFNPVLALDLPVEVLLREDVLPLEKDAAEYWNAVSFTYILGDELLEAVANKVSPYYEELKQKAVEAYLAQPLEETDLSPKIVSRFRTILSEKPGAKKKKKKKKETPLRKLLRSKKSSLKKAYIEATKNDFTPLEWSLFARSIKDILLKNSFLAEEALALSPDPQSEAFRTRFRTRCTEEANKVKRKIRELVELPTELRHYVGQLNEVILPAEVVNENLERLILLPREQENFISVKFTQEPTLVLPTFYSPELKDALSNLEERILAEGKPPRVDEIIMHQTDEKGNMTLALHSKKYPPLTILTFSIYDGQARTGILIDSLLSTVSELARRKPKLLSSMLADIFRIVPDEALKVFEIILSSSTLKRNAMAHRAITEARWDILVVALQEELAKREPLSEESPAEFKPFARIRRELEEGKSPSPFDLIIALRKGINRESIETKATDNGVGLDLESKRILLERFYGFTLSPPEIKKIFKHLNIKKGETVLNIGAGVSMLSLVAALMGAQVTIVEPSPNSAFRLKEAISQVEDLIQLAGGKITVIEKNLFDLKGTAVLAKDTYDHVWALDVLNGPKMIRLYRSMAGASSLNQFSGEIVIVEREETLQLAEIISRVKKASGGSLYISIVELNKTRTPQDNVVFDALKREGFLIEKGTWVSTFSSTLATTGTEDHGIIYKIENIPSLRIDPNSALGQSL